MADHAPLAWQSANRAVIDALVVDSAEPVFEKWNRAFIAVSEVACHLRAQTMARHAATAMLRAMKSTGEAEMLHSWTSAAEAVAAAARAEICLDGDEEDVRNIDKVIARQKRKLDGAAAHAEKKKIKLDEAALQCLTDGFDNVASGNLSAGLEEIRDCVGDVCQAVESLRDVITDAVKIQ